MAVDNLFLEYGCADGECDGSPSKLPLFPSKFSVFGDGSKTTLKKARYPSSDSIVVTGQPRYDLLTKARETFNSEQFRHNLNIDPGIKLVLIASQPFDSLDVV